MRGRGRACLFRVGGECSYGDLDCMDVDRFLFIYTKTLFFKYVSVCVVYLFYEWNWICTISVNVNIPAEEFIFRIYLSIQ